ncbi:hypothetical protein [Streptomyces pinistramenti]|uniref:hypothetical protein n=1 Tax=Streptomyces pinistramenti TaxID=2884812 RepID=UPI001D09134B|nr:hypothetical protein [Streptomyces pinistramenti]MCB5911681.1 hypothetical protein [Streptomyces pinistramenti]
MVVQGRRGRGAAAVAVAVACGAVLAAGALATGCSSDGTAVDGLPSAGSAVEDVRRTADALLRAGGARIRSTMETVSGGTRVAIRGTGGYDFRAARGQLELVLPDPAGERGGSRPPVTEILAPGVLYMKNRGAGVPADKWVRVDAASLADGNLVTGGATDPLTAAELLRGAGQVRYRGAQRLDGVAVRHYSGTTDIGAAAGAASARTKPALTAAEKGFTTRRVPFDAYLDEAGRLRKVRQSYHFANGSPKGASVTSTTQLDDFGRDTAVELPARDDIYAGKIAATGP